MSAKTILAAAASVLVLTGTGSSAVAERGRCAPPKAVTFNTSSNGIQTTSTDFVDVPNGAVRFSGSSVPNCVFVRFSAVSYIEPSYGAEFRALLDGSTVALPGPIPWKEGFPFTPNSFEFLFPAVGPGVHTVVMQWRAVNTGAGTLNMKERTLVVSY